MIEPNSEPTDNVDDNNINAENIVSENDSVQENETTANAPIEDASIDPTPAQEDNLPESKDEQISVIVEEKNMPEVIISEASPEVSEKLPVESEKIPEAKTEKITQKPSDSDADNDHIEDLEEIEEEHPDFDEDFSAYDKKGFVDLAEKMLVSISSRNITTSDVKNIDNVIKSIRPVFDDISSNEKNDAKKEYIATNGSIEGFSFKNDNYAIRFEGILIQIREKRQNYFNKLEREREDYFEIKTRLLQTLRDIVETEEKGESKNNWDAFKKLQSDWKNAGNVNSPHNGTLWSAYNALIDRYFDIRSIQNELKDLDRKKNLEHKEECVIKIEEIAAALKETPLTNVVLKKANDLLNEYKQIGPGPREEQDILWKRLKGAFDVIYEKKRELSKENLGLMEDTLNAKTQIFESLKPFIEFKSDSINEWNAKTKEVMAIQDQWNAIKGSMPREKGKDISKDFWATLKLFFKNKSEFFAGLEAKREGNYIAKEAIVIEVDAIVESGDTSAPNTNRIIELQKKWRTIGHVPEKYKDTLYHRFKASCDSYFNSKRDENKAQDKEFADNLAAKEAICIELETLIAAGGTDLKKLNDFKKQFTSVGFVPRKNMQTIQNRFIKAVNDFVKASTGLDKGQKDKLILQSEVDVASTSRGGSRNLDRTENDIRRKIKTLEDDISQTKNNLEFFGYSKGAEKLKEEYMKKVEKAEKEIADLSAKLKMITSAS